MALSAVVGYVGLVAALSLLIWLALRGINIVFAALLTYGGVVVFVVIFAMYPLGMKLLQQANIPKRVFPKKTARHSL